MPRIAFYVAFLIWMSAIRPAIHADEIVSRQVTKADMPRIPHTPANEALATFRLAAGFRLELVAAEPMVADPVDACFDEFGRMFIAEMHGYPFSQEATKLNPEGGGKVNAGIIRMLEDTDQDGVMDCSVVFADGISWPTSVCCYNGGIFVIAPQYLYYLKDTTGDGRADLREIILSGFGRGNVQAVTNGLLWGLDNRIYFAAGRNPTELRHRDRKLFSVRGTDLRFDPRTEQFEAVTGGLQFGHSQDDWGTRFVCSNSNHIQQVVFPRGYLSRNPYLAASGAIRSIATDGASARVFRRSPPEPWRIIRQKWRAADKGYRLEIDDDGGWKFIPVRPGSKAGVIPTEYPVGFFTSATGITIYRGSAYPEKFRGNAFVGDVGGNLVHRKTVDTTNVVYRATRADSGEELLASSDNWFRPVNFVNAPDGCLYILDMYRETIEHPHSIPEEIKRFCDLTSGHDRGRIYRLVSPDAAPVTPKALGSMDERQLVAELASDNGWNRDTAQRLLWERQNPKSVAFVEQLLQSALPPAGRIHALSTLQGLDALNEDHLQTALKDQHARVRAHAVRLTEPFLQSSPMLNASLAALVEDPSPHVRFQLAFSLGESNDAAVPRLLAKLLADPASDSEIQTAVYSSCGGSASAVVERLATYLPDPRASAAISQLGQFIGANPRPDDAIRLIQFAVTQDSATSRPILTELGRGLMRRGTTLWSILKNNTSTQEAMAEQFRKASAECADSAISLAIRRQNIELLSFADDSTAFAVLPPLLSSTTPPPLQLAAVRALSMHDADTVPQTLLGSWRTCSPAVRREIVAALMSNGQRSLALLDALEQEHVQRGDIERTVKQQLMTHSDKTISRRSRLIFGSGVTTSRTAVVQQYQHVLDLPADATNGQAVFRKTCSICHRVGNTGHKVAPDLESVKNKSAADLLIAILDPNREAQPGFNVYNIVTRQGRTFHGIIAEESAGSITLRQAEAREEVVLRSNIEQMSATGKSLMPEGLEKDLTAQQLADVIAFVKSIKQTPSTLVP